jgi:ATP-binding cassette, subfamily B, bacterial
MMIEPEEIPGVDGNAPLDLTGDLTVDAWRGVAAEDVDEPSPGLAGLLRSRSRKLLWSLARPHRRALLGAGVLIACNTAAQLAGPFLVQVGIDHGIPPLMPGGSGTLRPLVGVVVALVLITVIGAATLNGFLVIVGRVGQDAILELRRRVFKHV